MLYEIYKLGLRDCYAKVESNNPKEAICSALKVNSKSLNIMKVDPYMANYCVKCVDGKRNTANYYYITLKNNFMDAREYGYDLDSYQITVHFTDFRYFHTYHIDNSFEYWKSSGSSHSTLLLNKETGLIIVSHDNDDEYPRSPALGMNDYERCIKRFREKGKFGLKCKARKGYYVIQNGSKGNYDIEI